MTYSISWQVQLAGPPSTIAWGTGTLTYDAILKSVFVTEFGLYRFKVMPFKMKNNPATFQHQYWPGKDNKNMDDLSRQLSSFSFHVGLSSGFLYKVVESSLGSPMWVNPRLALPKGGRCVEDYLDFGTCNIIGDTLPKSYSPTPVWTLCDLLDAVTQLEELNERNLTAITEFLILGFENLHTLKSLLFILFLIIYIFTIVGNLIIIVLVLTSHHVQSPMYFFLSHLSLCDTLLTTNAVPNMLRVILEEGSTMPVNGCLTQFYLLCASTIAECFLLMVMSYDRYIAICIPLRYSSIMGRTLCLILVFLSWTLGTILPLMAVIPVFHLHFCGTNVIDHFYCDFAPLMELSCSDTTLVEREVFVSSIPTVVIPFIFIIVTYVYIFYTIMSIPSTTGRKKAFSTCSSHLAVVSAYYGTLITKYMVPFRGHSVNINKTVSLLYTVFTPLFNPFIYSLRNKEIKVAITKCFLQGLRH
ncbi:olfactory receptor 11L1-like [Pelodytes ibericus]